MGQRDLRRLLVCDGGGALGGHARRDGAPGSPALSRKPRKLVAVALANRMARAWALMTNNEVGSRRRLTGGEAREAVGDAGPG